MIKLEHMALWASDIEKLKKTAPTGNISILSWSITILAHYTHILDHAPQQCLCPGVQPS